MDFSETIAASDLKVGRSRHLIEYMKVCEYWRSRSLLDLGPRSCTYKNSNRIFSAFTLLIWTKFFMKAFRYKEMKIWWHDAGHMTQDGRQAHIWKKPLKNLLLRNRQTDLHETWYVASGTSAHHSLFKWWPASVLDLFYGKVKFGYLGFSMGKSENSGFFGNYYSQWPESW